MADHQRHLRYSLIPSDQMDASDAATASANQKQQEQWITISKIIIDYFVAHAQINLNTLTIPSLPVPASGLDDSGGHACTGTAHTNTGTITGGTGTLT